MTRFHRLLLAALPLLSSPAAAGWKAKEGKAGNFLFETDPKALASTVHLVFPSGSMADPKGKEGLAKLAFQSLLRGTKSLSKDEFFASLERLGGSIEIDVGAGRTILTLHAVSENLEAATRLMSQAVTEPALSDAEIDNLRREILGQLEQELSNNRRLLKRVFRQALFRGTSLSFPPEGTIEGMKSVTNAELRDFLGTRLRSGSLIVAAASNRPAREIRGWLEAQLSTLPDGKAPELDLPKPKKLSGRTLYVLDRPGSATTEVAIGHFGILASSPDRVTLEPGMFAFGEDMTSILFQELREKKGWTYGAAAGFDLFERPRRYAGGFMLYSFPQAQHTEAALLRMLELFEEFSSRGLDAGKLAYASKALSNSYPFKFASSRARLTNSLYEKLEEVPHRGVAEYRRLLRAVSPARLQQALKRNLDPANSVIVVVGDPSRTAPLAAKIPGLRATVKLADAMAPMTE